MEELEYLLEQFLEKHTDLKGLDQIYERKAMAQKIVDVLDGDEACCQQFIEEAAAAREENDDANKEIDELIDARDEVAHERDTLENELEKLRLGLEWVLDNPNADMSDIKELLQ